MQLKQPRSSGFHHITVEALAGQRTRPYLPVAGCCLQQTLHCPVQAALSDNTEEQSMLAPLFAFGILGKSRKSEVMSPFSALSIPVFLLQSPKHFGLAPRCVLANLQLLSPWPVGETFCCDTIFCNSTYCTVSYPTSYQ